MYAKLEFNLLKPIQLLADHFLINVCSVEREIEQGWTEGDSAPDSFVPNQSNDRERILSKTFPNLHRSKKNVALR